MKHTAVVAIRRLPCLHQAARRLVTNYHEISGLVRLMVINLLNGMKISFMLLQSIRFFIC